MPARTKSRPQARPRSKSKSKSKARGAAKGQPARLTARHRAKAQREIARKLAELRGESGLSQAAVGKAVRLSASLVSKIERGERALDPLELGRFARLYGKSIVDFIT